MVYIIPHKRIGYIFFVPAAISEPYWNPLALYFSRSKVRSIFISQADFLRTFGCQVLYNSSSPRGAQKFDLKGAKFGIFDGADCIFSNLVKSFWAVLISQWLVHKMCIRKSVKKKWKRLLVSWIMCWTHFWKCNFKIKVDLQETFTYLGILNNTMLERFGDFINKYCSFIKNHPKQICQIFIMNSQLPYRNSKLQVDFGT